MYLAQSELWEYLFQNLVTFFKVLEVYLLAFLNEGEYNVNLISTGGSSLKAVEALRQYGVEVIGMVASFTYGFPVAEEAFREAGVRLVTLSDYNAVLEQAAETGYIKKEEIEVLNEWRKSPSTWKQND